MENPVNKTSVIFSNCPKLSFMVTGAFFPLGSCRNSVSKIRYQKLIEIQPRCLITGMCASKTHLHLSLFHLMSQSRSLAYDTLYSRIKKSTTTPIAFA